MAHPYDKQAKTGQQRADARYDASPPKVPDPVYMAEARSDPKDKKAAEVFVGAPARQISNYGNVRK